MRWPFCLAMGCFPDALENFRPGLRAVRMAQQLVQLGVELVHARIRMLPWVAQGRGVKLAGVVLDFRQLQK